MKKPLLVFVFCAIVIVAWSAPETLVEVGVDEQTPYLSVGNQQGLFFDFVSAAADYKIEPSSEMPSVIGDHVGRNPSGSGTAQDCLKSNRPVEGMNGALSFTAGLWMTFIGGHTNGRVISNSDETLVGGMDLFQSGTGQLKFRVNGQIASDPMAQTLELTSGGNTYWQFVAVSYDGSRSENNVAYYIGDGTTLTLTNRTSLGAGAVGNSENPLTVFNHPTLERPLTGLYDNVRIAVSDGDESGALDLAAIAQWMTEPVRRDALIGLGSYGTSFLEAGGDFIEATTLYSGMVGEALRFASITPGYARGGYQFEPQNAPENLRACTLVFWGAMQTVGCYFSLEDDESNQGLALSVGNDSLILRVNGQQVTASTIPYWQRGNSAWRFVALSYDGEKTSGNASFWMGEEGNLHHLGDFDLPAGVVNLPEPSLIIGNRKQQDSRPRGLIDGVRLYQDYCLNEESLTDLMESDLAEQEVPCDIVYLDAGLPDGSGQRTTVTYATQFWSERALGNHRTLVSIDSSLTTKPAIQVTLPLRRQGVFSDDNDVEVQDLATGTSTTQWIVREYTKEKLDVVFQPLEGVMEYAIYYAIWRNPQVYADSSWASFYQSATGLPQAQLDAMQARTPMDRFDPMEIAMTEAETADFLAENTLLNYFLFPEDAAHPIAMYFDLPLRWMDRAGDNALALSGSPDEYVAFQIGVYAARQDLQNVRVQFGALSGSESALIPAGAFTFFNGQGTDTWGEAFSKNLDIAQGEILPLWCGVQLPQNLPPDVYTGQCTVLVDNATAQQVNLAITVDEEVLQCHGDMENRNLSRLRWLNSTAGLEDTVTAPYTAIQKTDQTIAVLGREIHLGEGGLPTSILSAGQEVLAAPITWQIDFPGGAYIEPAGEITWTLSEDHRMEWQAVTGNSDLVLELNGLMEFDGYGELILELSAQQNVNLDDIELVIPIDSAHAGYMNGLGVVPGDRPSSHSWQWGPPNSCFWLGSPKAGFYGRPKGEKDYTVWRTYEGYEIPVDWDNAGQGRIQMSEDSQTVKVSLSTGPRSLTTGESLQLRFAFMATPVRPLSKERFDYRYIHQSSIVPASVGAHETVFHHGGCYENPFLNYPFPKMDLQKTVAQNAQEFGVPVVLYYSHGRYSIHSEELWAFRAMRHELLSTDGMEEYDPDGSFDNVNTNDIPWLREHLLAEYVPGWMNTLPSGEVDISLVPKNYPTRYDNYYLGGAKCLMENLPIGGFYQDGHRHNRKTAQRLRRIMKAANPDALLNYHSGNPYKEAAGYQDAIMWYMENLPYVDSVWFGENFMYQDMSPDQWLVSVSGIPFGVPGEMLSISRHPANVWRGMLYGIDHRIYGLVVGNPPELWALWDSFGIQDAEMMGYWEENCPVQTGDPDILATVFRRSDRAMIVLASWAEESRDIQLVYDWSTLGFGEELVDTLVAPPLTGLQSARSLTSDETISVEPAGGGILILSRMAPAGTKVDWLNWSNAAERNSYEWK